jgi:hypothetical protein
MSNSWAGTSCTKTQFLPNPRLDSEMICFLLCKMTRQDKHRIFRCTKMPDHERSVEDCAERYPAYYHVAQMDADRRVEGMAPPKSTKSGSSASRSGTEGRYRQASILQRRFRPGDTEVGCYLAGWPIRIWRSGGCTAGERWSGHGPLAGPVAHGWKPPGRMLDSDMTSRAATIPRW